MRRKIGPSAFSSFPVSVLGWRWGVSACCVRYRLRQSMMGDDLVLKGLAKPCLPAQRQPWCPTKRHAYHEVVLYEQQLRLVPL